MGTKKEVALKRTSAPLQLSNQHHILGFANELRTFIEKSGLSCLIKGSKYANVDGWKYAGLNFNLTNDPAEPIALHKEGEVFTVLYKKVTKKGSGNSYEVEVPFYAGQIKEEIEQREKKAIRKEILPLYKYKCNCEIKNITTDKVVCRGFSIVTNMELAKVSFDEYAIHAQAQTRSIGRGYKNILGFVMKAAGYEPVPKEEADEKTKDESSSEFDDQVKEQIELMTSTTDLKKYWNQLPELHTNEDFKAAMNKRREEILSNQKKTAKPNTTMP